MNKNLNVRNSGFYIQVLSKKNQATLSSSLTKFTHVLGLHASFGCCYLGLVIIGAIGIMAAMTSLLIIMHQYCYEKNER